MDIRIIDKYCSDYPEKLKSISNSPDKLYVLGNEKLLKVNEHCRNVILLSII